MRNSTLILFLLASLLSYGQGIFMDDFNDGSILTDSAWVGDVDDFDATTGELNLAAAVAGQSAISTAVPMGDSTVWELLAGIDFSPSDNNQFRIWLSANAADLYAPPAGYYLEIGESGTDDAITLVRKNLNGSTDEIARGTDGTVAAAFTVNIRIIRTPANVWTLETDYTGGTAYTQEFSVTEMGTPIPPGTNFGLWCKYSISNADGFVFDNVKISPLFVDTMPPQITEFTIVSPTMAEIRFNENVAESSAEIIGNYIWNNGVTTATAERDAVDFSLVRLGINETFLSGTTYSVTITDVADLNGNPIPVGMPEMDDFLYIEVIPAAPFDIIVNEIMYDPTNLPNLPNGVEYIELYNRSANPVDLSTLFLEDGGGAYNIPTYTLEDGGYITLVDIADVNSFNPGITLLGMVDFPTTLTNGGEPIVIKRVADSVVIDSVYYDPAWGGNDASLERINPNAVCDVAANWATTMDSTGGTPSRENSIFDDALDTEVPIVTQFNIVSNQQLSISFDEVLSADSALILNNYTITGIGNPSSVTLPSSDAVNLDFGSPVFVHGIEYTLTLTNIEDCIGGNVLDTTILFTYYDISDPLAYDILINEIMTDSKVPAELPIGVKYIELYNRSDKAFQLSNISLADNNGPRTLPAYVLPPMDYITLCDADFVDSFLVRDIPILGMNSFPTPNLSDELLVLTDLIDQEIIHSIFFRDWDCDDGSCSMELQNPNLYCQEEGNWFPSVDSTGGTPSRKNSVFDDSPDITTPSVTQVSQLSSQSVLLVFDEGLNANSAVAPGVYTLDGTLNPTVVNLPQTNQVELDFGTAVFVNEVTYNIEIIGVGDCAGGNTLDTIVQFTYYDIANPNPNDILISEIMADPKILAGLPIGAKYIELYNRSDSAFQLSTILLEDNTSAALLPTYILPPGKYITLCDEDFVDEFQAVEIAVLGMSSFPAPNLANETLSLTDVIDNEQLFSIYFRNWDCDDGSCSMELKNLNLYCQEEGNWFPSEDPSGGTPSRPNSHFDNTPDTTLPEALEAQADGQTIFIQFNEPLNIASATDTAHYSIDGGIGAPNLVEMEGSSGVLLTYDTAVFIDGTTYTITINNVEDCSGGNTIALDTELPFVYFETGVSTLYSILLNEIMANPNPKPIGYPAMEYVELYNRSDKAFNLKGMTLQGKLLPFYILPSGAYVAIHPDTDIFDADVPAITLSDFDGITNDGELIELKSAMGNIVNAFYYSPDCHTIAGRDEGWSLERINPNLPCNQCDNWQTSPSELGGTPGKENEGAAFSFDEVLPDLVKVFPVSDTTVRLYFSEAMNIVSASTPANYAIDNGLGNPVVATAEGPIFTSVLLRLATPLESGIIYTLTVNTVNDCLGNPIGMFNSLQFALPESIEPGDLILNEILYNPVTGGSDFVELFNHSDKVVSLAELILANYNDSMQVANLALVGEECLLFPGEYVAFSPFPSQILLQYETPNPKGVLKAKLPSYPDDMGDVLLFADGKLIDEFHYDKDYAFALLDDENGVSLERIDPDAPTQDPSNWHSAAESVGFATPAYKNSQDGELIATGNEIFIEQNVLSPDSDGYQDFLIINYQLDQPGFVANVSIYDAKGRLVKSLVQNELLSPVGEFKWDGDTDYGEKARLGVYVVYSELFSVDGRKTAYKHSCVVAGQL